MKRLASIAVLVLALSALVLSTSACTKKKMMGGLENPSRATALS